MPSDEETTVEEFLLGHLRESQVRPNHFIHRRPENEVWRPQMDKTNFSTRDRKSFTGDHRFVAPAERHCQCHTNFYLSGDGSVIWEQPRHATRFPQRKEGHVRSRIKWENAK